MPSLVRQSFRLGFLVAMLGLPLSDLAAQSGTIQGQVVDSAGAPIVGAIVSVDRTSLGATTTMEDYLHYITNIVAGAGKGTLQPVYGIAQEMKLVERTAPGLADYRGMGPVRIGNEAYAQVQNDSYGAVVLASAQAFFDQRLVRPGGADLFHRL